MTHLDGNVLAGVGSTFFSFDVSSATGQCDACEDVATLARATVYGAPMGFVVRCRNCQAILIVITERRGDAKVDMRGLRWLAPAAGDAAHPSAGDAHRVS